MKKETKITKNKMHPKIERSIIKLLLPEVMPFYGEFLLYVNFHEAIGMGSAGVNVSDKGMNFYYDPEFIDRLTEKQLNFLIIHEIFHFLFDHQKRTKLGGFNHKLSNVAQDMIINQIIIDDVDSKYVEIIKKDEEDKKNEHLGVFLPNEYEGPLNFESLYEWLYNKWEEHEKQKQQGGDNDEDSDGDEDGEDQGKPSYGKYGKNGLECNSLEYIFDNMAENDGQFMDVHMSDEVADDQKREFIKNVTEGLKARGLTQGNMETILNKLQKKRKDYLREIKRQIASNIMGTIKTPTITRPNRKSIFGLKGKKKVKTVINCLLDTSGSMGSDFDKVLSYIFQNDIEINLVQCDTRVQHSVVVKNKRDLEKMKIKGLGGTTLQPGVDYIAEHHNQFNTVILTDGYTDSFDFRKLKGNVLIISSGVECPISATNKRVKQILIEKEKA